MRYGEEAFRLGGGHDEHDRNLYGVVLQPSTVLLVFAALTSSSRADAPGPEFTECGIEGKWGLSGEFGMIVRPAAAQAAPTAALDTGTFDAT